MSSITVRQGPRLRVIFRIKQGDKPIRVI